ncbi:MAG: hemerythrin domain-containing protein [Armatimonadota bacterium]
MKRAPELHGLSHDHNRGLVLARALRRAARGERPLQRAVSDLLAAWETELEPHFRAEEELLLPELARFVPADDPLIVRTLVEHVALRRAVRALAAAKGEACRLLAAEIGQALDDHIRFEERVLFPYVEATLPPAELAALGAELGPTRAAACRLPSERERPSGA